MNVRLAQIGLILIVLAMIWLPEVTNHTEAEDAYSYALAAETYEYRELLHPHHRLYHPLSKLVFDLSGAERSFSVLQVLSGIFSSLAVLIFYLILGRVGVVSLWMKAGYTLLLVSCYGFWRYAREVEVYPMSWLALLIGVYWMLGPPKGWRFWLGLTLGLVVAVNVHKALSVPLAAMSASLIVFSRSWKSGAFSVAGAMCLFFLVELSMSQIREDRGADAPERGDHAFTAPPSEVPRPSKGFRFTSLPKGGIGLGASLVGSYPVFAFDEVYSLLKVRLFPYRNFHEERFLVKGMSNSAKMLWVGALVVFVVSSCGYLVSAWRHRNNSSQQYLLIQRILMSGGISFALLILFFEPGNPEMWLIGLPLILVALASLCPELNTKVLFTGVLSLTLVNWLGGMSLMNRKEGDYDRVTGAILLEEKLTEDDVYLVAAHLGVHGRFARYVSEANIVRGDFGAKKHEAFFEFVSSIFQKNGRIILHRTAWESLSMDREILTKRGWRDIRNSDSGIVEIIEK